MQTLYIKKSSAKTFTINVTNEDGTPRDITTADFYITIRNRNTINDIDDSFAIIDKQLTKIDALN